MKTYIIDANIVLKWLSISSEDGAEQAKNLYERLKAGNISLFAPTFLLVEVSNILLKKKKFSKEEVNGFLKVLLVSGINFVDFNYLQIDDLLDIAATYKVTSYDALYLLLASEMNCKLISEDEELVLLTRMVVNLEKI